MSGGKWYRFTRLAAMVKAVATMDAYTVYLHLTRCIG